MIILYIVLNLFVASWAEPRRVETRMHVPRPSYEDAQRISAQNTTTVFNAWITMPIDHFDPQNSDTFQTQYLYTDEFFGGDGYPVFIYVGGDWPALSGFLYTGHLPVIAQENRGYLIYLEHRYYGDSLPYRDFTVENLRFLDVNQALADLAYFIQDLKKNPKFTNSKIILYGGFYGGNLALWFKQKYPHLVAGTIASSAPILAKVDFTELLEVTEQSFLSDGGEQCIATIKQGIEDTVAALATEQGRRAVEEAYTLCWSLETADTLDLGDFVGLITSVFSYTVQLARPGTLTEICNKFGTDVYGIRPMQKVGGFVAEEGRLGDSCWGISYEYYVRGLLASFDQRAWYYKQCTQLGYFHTIPSSGTMFDKLKWLDLNFHLETCRRVFDHRFTPSFVNNAVDRFNVMFGGLEPDVNNTINLHGAIDPWHVLGVHDRDLKETSPTFLVPRASHTFDMGNPHPSDTVKILETLRTIRSLVKEWLT